jgi:hypothetical protein
MMSASSTNGLAMLAHQDTTSSGTRLGQSAVALLPVAVSLDLHSQHQPWSSSCFAANVDGAEKGPLDSVAPLISMKRSSIMKSTQHADAAGKSGQEHGASTSVDVHVGLQSDIAIEDSVSIPIGPETGGGYYF